MYFAYGSNMAQERLRARVPSAETVGVGILKGYELKFHKIGKDKSGKCDASKVNNKQGEVYGVLYSVLRKELTLLDRYEGAGYGYERQTVVVQRPPDEEVAAETYLATRVDAAFRPFDWYREHVLRGARAANLPDSYIQAIAATPTVDDPDTSRRTREMAIYPEWNVSPTSEC
ncbi:gamma-glutamylcyclotransferase family protein [Caenimonas soli]|uniref:gamma-glutamylcyclotransferase family protein n=1 Tax=Caenimonas soli TaxID=2735555 RepID=UPI001555DC94|nr:gamma-glutamylcyclotransferase family protein [Caenimonas soli]NPC59308.1 gamma-glutamylcyclotransferase [Caenimonas soli]